MKWYPKDGLFAWAYMALAVGFALRTEDFHAALICLALAKLSSIRYRMIVRENVG